MQVNGEGLPTGQPSAGSGDPNPQANTGGQGDPAPSTSNTNQPAASNAGGSGGDGADDSVEGLKRSLAAARKDADENAKAAREYKKSLDAEAAKRKEREDAEKDDLTKAQELAEAQKVRADMAEAKARQTALRYEVARAAATQNFADPEDAYRMIDWSQVEFDDEGQPQGVAPLVEKLAKDKSYLLKSTAPSVKPPPATPNSTREQRSDGMTSDDKKVREREVAAQIRQSF